MPYVPDSFAESDRATLHAFIAAHGFATLISPDRHDPPVTHLPLMLDPARGKLGVLTGHVARANRHWRRLDRRCPASSASRSTTQHRQRSADHAFIIPTCSTPPSIANDACAW
ncbi:MAG TPA: FMN-binding negative transcriptional regulator, partial [Burkholderiales bacterium]|nr:FMN-binding negative transcriptional regulator [Burkholderiales bacterium]